MTTKEIWQGILDRADESYKTFHKGLVPGCDTIVGVRVPVLRAYAKELLKQETAQELLAQTGTASYEERMLRGMLIGLQPKPALETVLEQIRQHVPLIDNWALCDVFCAGLKITKKHQEELYAFLQPYLESEQEFDRRFAVVMFLDYYVDEQWLPKILKIFDTMNREGYYVQMAVAWAVSVCFVKCYDQTLRWFDQCSLDAFTYQKSIQKACESYRLSEAQKKELKARKNSR